MLPNKLAEVSFRKENGRAKVMERKVKAMPVLPSRLHLRHPPFWQCMVLESLGLPRTQAASFAGQKITTFALVPSAQRVEKVLAVERSSWLRRRKSLRRPLFSTPGPSLKGP